MKKIKMNNTARIGFNTIGGAVAGFYGGMVLGTGMAVVGAVSDLCAPISYPVRGALAGTIFAIVFRGPKVNGNDILEGAFFGGLGGAAMIPLTPLNFVCQPLLPVIGSIVGAVALGKASFDHAKKIMCG